MKAFPRQASAVFVLVWVGSGVFCTSWALAKEPVIATASTNPTRPKLALFVTNLYSSEPVQAYPLGSSGDNAPLSSVPESSITGLSKPEGIARDSKGYLYVTNEWGHSVTVYAAGANGKVAPISSIEVNSDPTGIALDSKGAIYVTNWIGDSIEVFAAVPLSSGTPSPTNAVAAATRNLAGVRSEELIGRVIASATKSWTTFAIGGDATET